MKLFVLALGAGLLLCAGIASAQQQFRNSNPIVQPAQWVAVSASNTTDLPQGVAKGLYIDQAGTLAFIPADNLDNAVVSINVVAGTRIDGFVRRVLSTGTSATGIFALY